MVKGRVCAWLDEGSGIIRNVKNLVRKISIGDFYSEK